MRHKDKKVNRGDLQQTLSERFVWAIAYGSCIGWGSFILPGDWIKSSGPIATSIGIIIGALLMILIAVSYGALVERFPVSGGAFAFSFLGFGRYVSFFSAWFITFGYVCVVALNATAFSLLIKFIFPSVLQTGKLYSIAGWDVYITEIILATVLLLVFMLIAIKGASVSGTLQYYFCIAMVIVVILMFLGSFFAPNFDVSSLQPLSNPDKGWFQSIIAIVAIAPWAFVGFDNIPQTAEEFDFKPNKTFKLIVYSLLAAALTYVLMLLYTGWLENKSGNLNGNLWLTGTVTKDAFGMVGLGILALAIIMGIFTGLNGFLMSSSRLLFSMGRSGIMPTVFSKLHRKYKTPYVAIIFLVLVSMIAPWLGRNALTWIVDMSSTGVSVGYLITCLAAAKLFSYNKESNTYAPVYKTFAIIGSIMSFIFLCLLLVPFSPAVLSMPSFIALGAWTLLGLIFFFIRLPKLKKMNKDELSRLILNRKEEDLKSLVGDDTSRK
ncbi:APC family permease [Staphylococcus massiliensis]|uniref:Cationic amino acid transporter n=1 Tax=Staphylococcus massiliensis S46 TaxID=1229783 RepID=K9AN44_9STAP|nr:APC family permease [Staphylococcus massiliensis]EKU47456.1 cationic amino acid transporter [Staphylococcus massiliensis S46]MCG3400372.1 APC family permease [Staphylococcus massiliensis]MCG3401935.1 APC family permease [Staphylococcus massiliensis]MCG3412402.1 APC family permease [Staphylococcus massiliensis]POA01442.1 APC family permease [Staphylococcus massiliensis CCUG 55927]